MLYRPKCLELGHGFKGGRQATREGNLSRQDIQALDVMRQSLARREILQRLRAENSLVELEIGSNLGDFLVRASRAFPETLFVGVEVSPELASACAERLLRRGATNARVIHSEAVTFLREHVAVGAIQRVHVYFPTPYHKALGLERPLLRQELFEEIHRILVPDGTLNILVDLKQDAKKIRALANPARWKRKRFSPLPLGQPSPYYVGTPSEVRYSALRQIFPFRLKKIVTSS